MAYQKGTAKRVLLYALLIGVQSIRLRKGLMRALAHASIFHDTRRHTISLMWATWGTRAASDYMKYREQNKDLVFLETGVSHDEHHDRDDKVGMEAIGIRPRPGR